MILSYFTIFSLKRKVSLEEKIVLSYMLNEDDMSRISKSVRNIIYTSLFIEAAGTFLLYFPFSKRETDSGKPFSSPSSIPCRPSATLVSLFSRTVLNSTKEI